MPYIGLDTIVAVGNIVVYIAIILCYDYWHFGKSIKDWY